MDEHRRVAEMVGGELASRDDVLAVLITGSIGRGEHVESSDVDLAVVLADDSRGTQAANRTLRDGLLVEWGARTEADWITRFDRPKSSWLYVFLEGHVLHDTGVAARLAGVARDTLVTYRTSDVLRSELATLLWHGQAKLDRALASDDPEAQGFWASLVVSSVFDGLYAIHDVPLPAGARRHACLHHVPLTTWEHKRLTAFLTDGPRQRIEACRDLVAHLRAKLGPPDLERV